MNSEKVSKEIKKILLQKAFDCGQSVHLGGALSMIDLMAVLYQNTLKFDSANPTWQDRDYFILSKGHTILGYLSTLYYYGYFNQEVFDTFQTNGSKLIAHPIKNLELGIESSNGSLGQGLSYASGMAIGFKKRHAENKVFVMMGDGECNEGSVWEAAQLSAELELNNLVAIVDQNRLRNDGETAYKGNLNLVNMWHSFGWHTIEVDGHDHSQIFQAFKEAEQVTDKPIAIIANTIKGKGVEFMEDNNDWHHNRLTEKNFDLAMIQLGDE